MPSGSAAKLTRCLKRRSGSGIADEVGRTHERVHITRKRPKYVVLLTAEDLESMEATLELLTDSRAQERIAASEADFAGGDVLDEHQLRALMGKRPRTQPE